MIQFSKTARIRLSDIVILIVLTVNEADFLSGKKETSPNIELCTIRKNFSTFKTDVVQKLNVV